MRVLGHLDPWKAAPPTLEDLLMGIRHRRSLVLPIVAFLALDTLAAGMGMGVPIFPILLGFPVGWLLPRFLPGSTRTWPQALRRLLLFSGLTASYTFLLMLLIWGPTVRLLFDPAADLANFGIPMILYQPRASFIGWQVLMILISPFLQLLTTLFGAHVAMVASLSRGPGLDGLPSPQAGIEGERDEEDAPPPPESPGAPIADSRRQQGAGQ
jgi:hypothetical protein